MRWAFVGLIAVAPVSAAARAPTGEQALAAAIRDRPVLSPATCIDLQQIRSMRIIADTAIVYDLGGRLYVNRPTTGAATLRRDDVPVSRIDGGELCRIDTVTLLDPVTRMQCGFVVLGSFVVYGPRPQG